MQEQPVVSSNPISLVTADGKQLSIPLSALYFDSTGKLNVERWPLYPSYASLVDRYLKRLLDSGALGAGEAPPAKPALKAKGLTVGAAGVEIVMEFSNVSLNAASPPSSTVDAKVTETDRYAALAITKLAETLGTDAGTGKRPGLALLVAGGTPALPKEGSYAFSIAQSGTAAKAEIPKNTGQGAAFSLQARSDVADGAALKATVEKVNVSAKTFDLVISWTKSVTATAIGSLAASFNFVLAIEAPPGGYRAPAPGKVVLAGGADAVSLAAAPPSATVLSSQ